MKVIQWDQALNGENKDLPWHWYAWLNALVRMRERNKKNENYFRHKASKGESHMKHLLMDQWTKGWRVQSSTLPITEYTDLSTHAVHHVKCSLSKLTCLFACSSFFSTSLNQRWTQGFAACKFQLSAKGKAHTHTKTHTHIHTHIYTHGSERKKKYDPLVTKVANSLCFGICWPVNCFLLP